MFANHEIWTLIVCLLDGEEDMASLAMTNRYFYNLCKYVHGPAVIRLPRNSMNQAIMRFGALSISSSLTPPPTSKDNMPPTPADSGSDDDDKQLSIHEDQEGEEVYYTAPITAEAIGRIACIPGYRIEPTLPNLPTELQQQIFSYLDKIDSVCLGLTSRHAYAMFEAIHGHKMALNTRRSGPNTLESAWEVVGKQSCNHCGTDRCELWRHIKSWMPQELEYCSMKHLFGSRAKEGAHPTCFRNKPSKPRRCGRHPERTITMHQDDNPKVRQKTQGSSSN